MALFEALASFRVTLTPSLFTVEPSPGTMVYEDASYEEAMLYLEAARSAHTALESRGAAVLERDAARFARDLAPRLISARQAALEALRHMRAVLGFMVDLSEEEAVGVTLIPDPPPSGPAEPSAEFSW